MPNRPVVSDYTGIPDKFTNAPNVVEVSRQPSFWMVRDHFEFSGGTAPVMLHSPGT